MMSTFQLVGINVNSKCTSSLFFYHVAVYRRLEEIQSNNKILFLHYGAIWINCKCDSFYVTGHTASFEDWQKPLNARKWRMTANELEVEMRKNKINVA